MTDYVPLTDDEKTVARTELARMRMANIDRAPLARDLDAAGIPNWQVRLRDARRRDPSGRQYDLEWGRVKGEFLEYLAKKGNAA